MQSKVKTESRYAANKAIDILLASFLAMYPFSDEVAEERSKRTTGIHNFPSAH
ncbi:MAG: hypothetical protein ACTS73_05325 [Arsenophonus sp. NEOnobi-MAG3]